MHIHFYKLLRSIEPESFFIVGFIIANLYITALKPYSVLIAGLSIALYCCSKNIIKTLWLVTLITALFFHGKYFTSPVYFDKTFTEYSQPISATFYIQFSDATLLVLIYILWRKSKTSQQYTHPPLNKHIILLMTMILLLGIASSWQSRYATISFFSLMQLTKGFIFFLLSSSLLSKPNFKKTTIELLLLYSLFNAGLIVAQAINQGPLGIPIESLHRFVPYGVYADESKSLYRPGGIVSSPNLYGSILGMTLPLMMMCAFSKKPPINKALTITTLITSSIAIFATYSRAVWIVIIPVVLYIARNLKLQNTTSKIPKTVKQFMCIVLLLISIVTIPNAISRVASIKMAFSPNGGVPYRLHHLFMGSELMMKKPFGVGLNVFQYEIVNKYDINYFFNDSTPAHNVFAEVGADLGLLGGFCFFMLIYYVVFAQYTSLKKSNHFNTYYQAIYYCLVCYICIVQFHPWIFERPIAEYFWILGGMFYASNA